jgi:hypothetical protein
VASSLLWNIRISRLPSLKFLLSAQLGPIRDRSVDGAYHFAWVLTGMSSLAPTATGKKKARARHVFGDAVVGDEVESSLSYSPSPRKPSKKMPLDESDEEVSVNKTLDYNSSSDSMTKRGAFIGDSGSSSASSTLQRCSGPFDKLFATSTDKENYADNRNSSISTDPTVKKCESAVKAEERLRRLRMQTRSPLRRDLVKATQDAINGASISVNQSLVAAHAAKKASLQNKTRATARIRAEWQEEIAEAKIFHSVAEQSRRHVLGVRAQLSSKFSKKKANEHLNHRQVQLKQAEEESQFKSSFFRDHQLALRQEADRRRRMSVATRATQRENNKRGQRLLQLYRNQEDQAIFEERAAASSAIRTTRMRSQAERRVSFQFRNGDARRIHALHAQMQANELALESESLKLKWASEKDTAEYKRRIEMERRESLARRNVVAQQIRGQEQERRSQELVQQHESFELKWAADRDAKEYRKGQQEELRKSLAGRNKLAFDERQESLQQQSHAANADHESYELQWAAERDVVAYNRSLDVQRRASLALRNAFARSLRQKAESEKAEAMFNEHASYELKWMAECDAQKHKQEVEKLRRESLALRNVEAKRHREMQTQIESDQLQATHESYELKWAGERDAKAHERCMASEGRQSLSLRSIAAQKAAREEQERASMALAAEHASYELKWAAEKDAHAYQRQLERERRESLAGRNKERLRHANVMEELRTIAREQETEFLILKWAGDKDAKAYLAKLEEERRLSLQQRGKQIVHARQIATQQQCEEISKDHANELLRAAAQKDVETYRNECAMRDRASLEYRRKEALVQRVQSEDQRAEQMHVEARNFQLESQAHSDVEMYLKTCRQRRRLSLAFRAKEKRHHGDWRQKQVLLQQQQQGRAVRDRMADRRYEELARQQERGRIAMDSIIHYGYSLF